MSDIALIVLGSSVAAIIGIALGVMLPALAMGKAIGSALEALSRQPESEQSIMRTLFIGLGDDRITGYLLSGYYFDCAVSKSIA
jgi:ATP synthase F0 subcomplex C subunit